MMKVLIVDDSQSIREALKSSLEKVFEGEIVTTASLLETRNLIDAGNPADFFLAILDLVLPDATRGEVVDYIQGKGIPVVIFTGELNQEIRQTIMKKDVIDYILKTSGRSVDYMVRLVKRLVINGSIRILVVDDSVSGRRMVVSLLKNYNFIVEEAESGTKALELLERDKEERNIRLVITDYLMPDMDGLELLRRIRRNYDRHEVAVIGLTGNEDDETVSARFIKEGANDFLTKGYIKEEFYYRVIQTLETLERIQELRGLNELKTKFIGMAAHDLKNPLNAVIGYARLLEATVASSIGSEALSFISKICTSAENMVHMINDILDVSYIASGQFHLACKPTDLRNLLSEQVEMNRIVAKNKNITIRSEFSEGPLVFCDPSWVQQAVDNLLSNAVKYSYPDTSILVSLVFEPGWARISVADKGQGIPEKEIACLFKDFQRLSPKPTGGEKSTGLGLSIVKAVVKAHGGEVFVHSAVGSGSTFSFVLPVSDLC